MIQIKFNHNQSLGALEMFVVDVDDLNKETTEYTTSGARIIENNEVIQPLLTLKTDQAKEFFHALQNLNVRQ